MLAGCIVDYLIANDIVPHREDFDIIADRVVQYFKTEDKVRLAADFKVSSYLNNTCVSSSSFQGNLLYSCS